MKKTVTATLEKQKDIVKQELNDVKESLTVKLNEAKASLQKVTKKDVTEVRYFSPIYFFIFCIKNDIYVKPPLMHISAHAIGIIRIFCKVL